MCLEYLDQLGIAPRFGSLNCRVSYFYTVIGQAVVDEAHAP